MKKDLLAAFFIILAAAVLLSGTRIQSVEEYYLTHVDDITAESETVFISIRCDTIRQNYDKLDKELREGDYLPADGVILPATEVVLRPGDTVFDQLDRVARANRIPMEYQGADENGFGSVYIPVSYTHLDVYKRQHLYVRFGYRQRLVQSLRQNHRRPCGEQRGGARPLVQMCIRDRDRADGVNSAAQHRVPGFQVVGLPVTINEAGHVVPPP